jgi:hypothetical protein
MAQDEDFSIFVEIICCFHPTDVDSTGEDGVYVKEVRLDPQRSPTLRAAASQATTEAIIAESREWLFQNTSVNGVEARQFLRFLRERLGRS